MIYKTQRRKDKLFNLFPLHLCGFALFFYFACVSFTFAAVAAEYDPVSIILTWQHDPSTTMTLTWITQKDREQDIVLYQKEEDNQWQTAVGNHIPMPEGLPYLIHRVELTELEPNSGYLFMTGGTAFIYKFRTMSDDPDAEIRFIVGGDMYHDTLEVLEQTNRMAASHDPMFVLVGGDITYAHGKQVTAHTAQRERWIEWFVAWKEQMVTHDGYLIPILPALGNHDVTGRYNQTPAQSPFYYALFAMPGEHGYNVLDFGNFMSVFILDSGHTHPIGGEQVHWLYHALEYRQHIPHKFAVYHIPAYPSVRKFYGRQNILVRKYWVPQFEKFGLTAAFEHHDHAYKRTPHILRNRIHPNGVLYLGDGAWGVSKPRTPKNPRYIWYLEKTASTHHFILVKIQKNKRTFTAIDDFGRVIDQTVSWAKNLALTN